MKHNCTCGKELDDKTAKFIGETKEKHLLLKWYNCPYCKSTFIKKTIMSYELISLDGHRLGRCDMSTVIEICRHLKCTYDLFGATVQVNGVVINANAYDIDIAINEL